MLTDLFFAAVLRPCRQHLLDLHIATDGGHHPVAIPSYDVVVHELSCATRLANSARQLCALVVLFPQPRIGHCKTSMLESLQPAFVHATRAIN